MIINHNKLRIKKSVETLWGEHLTVVKIRVNVNMQLKQRVCDMVIIIILYILYNYYFTVVNIYRCRTEL